MLQTRIGVVAGAMTQLGRRACVRACRARICFISSGLAWQLAWAVAPSWGEVEGRAGQLLCESSKSVRGGRSVARGAPARHHVQILDDVDGRPRGVVEAGAVRKEQLRREADHLRRVAAVVDDHVERPVRLADL